jgi:pilus assembly protein CpaB
MKDLQNRAFEGLAVRYKFVNMILLAVFVGAGAFFAAQKWLSAQENRRLSQSQLVPARLAPSQSLVVAAVPLRFGMEIGRQHLREVAWPEGALPKGAFSKIDDIIDGRTRRVALAAVEENEAVLPSKVTGPGQRASLAAVIEPGMKAVTVRVNDVNGVAGFVLPGERVDVLITRTPDKDAAFTDVLLQNMKVLAADQLADDRSDRPSLVKAITLEATIAQAQKLTLAATIGALSLTLRAAGERDVSGARRVALEDLLDESSARRNEASATKRPAAEHRVTVTVTRAMKRQEYSVPASGAHEPQNGGSDVAARNSALARIATP